VKVYRNEAELMASKGRMESEWVPGTWPVLAEGPDGDGYWWFATVEEARELVRVAEEMEGAKSGESPLIETVYRCLGCGFESKDEQAALACAKTPFSPAFKVGDIVVEAGAEEHHRYGWHDGDARWIYRRGDGMHGDRTPDFMSFYYVVTCVETYKEVTSNETTGPEAHSPVYHVRTGAMTGKDGHQGGWTRPRTHVALKLVTDPPPFIVEDSKRFLGQRSRGLL